ncbi:otogelin [Hippocampus comes]|uniref:otogelin n=1 Tax=Hippocampus comes TaxID=109280 RepID=UPI00094EA50E|nr:PREDICTED: otogelin-like [Hippocampus comes]
MDPYLGLTSWERLLYFFILYFSLIYPVQLSRSDVDVDNSNSDELYNNSTRIKQQKWDTTSQGRQGFQSTDVPFVPNTSSSMESLVSQNDTTTTAKDLSNTSLISKRRLDLNFTKFSSIVSAGTLPSRPEQSKQLQVTTASLSQLPNRAAASGMDSTSKAQSKQSLTTSAISKPSSTQTVLRSQSPTTLASAIQSDSLTTSSHTTLARKSSVTPSTQAGIQASQSSSSQSTARQFPVNQAVASVITRQTANQSRNRLDTLTSPLSSNPSPSDKAPIGSVKPSTQAPSNPTGNLANRIFSHDERPINASVFTRKAKEALRFHLISESCSFRCLNGGWCTQSKSCDCSLFQATGHRCQTVPNPGAEREMTCRTWGQYNFETFDGLYYYFPGRCTYTLLKECEETPQASIVVQVPNPGAEREMTCRTWGQYNFETFDGLYYYFPGRCTYTLLKECEETPQASIVVQVHNDADCGSESYSCQRSVSLFLPWEGEIRLHATYVTFKGQSLQLPHHIHDLHLEQISQYVLVSQTQGFTLAWEGRSGSVYIKLSPEFVGRTCGLCGNFNADVEDELRASYGVLTHEIEIFGNSWAETAPLQAPCPTVPSGFPSPCTEVDVHLLLKVEEICLMLLDPPFQSCHDFVSPLSYMASCFNDICLSGPTDDAVCQVFTEYSRACAHADHPLSSWRDHIPQCVKECPEGLQYLECISCCPSSCKQERTCIDSRLACLDGCYCPNGLILEDGSCVMPSDCPCEYHGVSYPSGQIVQEECRNCTCVAGLWNCTEYNCPGWSPPSRVLTHEIEIFGNSWAETAPLQAPCPTVPSGFPSPCTEVDVHLLLKVEEICLMLLDPPFQSCHDFVSPLSYMASCFNDICLSGPTDDAVCQVFTEYSRACAHADHPLSSWRDHIPQCVKECPEGLQYLECISCCPSSCKQERTCIDSRLACLDGCYCPNGLILEDGSCVMPSDCPCEYHGVSYPSGQIVQEECRNCTCVAGLWNCTEYNCPGECSVTGDIYFQSFDGRIYTFPATCQYVLAKSRNSGKFTVTIQNAPCGANLDGSCIQSVNLVIDEDARMEITLSHNGEVFIAGHYRISLPYSDDNFHIQELSSMFLQVKTMFGLRLQYAWKEFRLYLQASAQWKDDTVGLCGTFNGNIQDDFLSPSGMIESTPLLFGNAWKVSSACTLSLIPPQLDPCDTHQQAVAYASEMCDVLNQDLFSPCHEYLSPVPFHQQCRSDTCKCGTACFCSALAHYARHCRRFSILIDFRSRIDDCAVTCPTTMQYGMCVSSCQRRCSALSSSQHCGRECEEGCVCPLGLFYDQRTHACVHRNECPCTFLGAEYEPGDVIMTSAGVQLCLDGIFVSQTTDGDSLCPVSQFYHNCSDGENGLLPGRGVACERTCESYLLNLTCSAHEPCASGCTCPSGLLKHGDECFEPEACPCLWKGKEYYPGDKVSSPCHQCVCQHGTFQCVFRPCPSMCTTYGDRHYRTFDGLLFDYIGACQVYLVKSSADLILSVTAENIDCFGNGIICRKSLLINIGRSFLTFDDDTGQPNPTSVLGRNQKMIIWPAGYFTVIHFPEEDITILWDRKTTIHIQVGPHWQGKLSGLCGNFDLKTVNEMRTPDNIDTTSPQEFGNSWTAVECVNGPDMRHPCTLTPLKEPFAKQQCAVLLSEVFQACHPVVDVTWFYMNCLADTCGCNLGGDCECFCTSVAAYAQRCCHQGIPVDWRSPSLCPHDCEFYNKVLGKGPFRLLPFRDRTSLLVASRSSGSVFVKRGNLSDALSHFMMTPGLSRARPHDTSRISFEAAHRPNHFLFVSPSGQVKLVKWEQSEAFWDGATFVLHRDTWLSGYDSLESHAKPGFFLHATLPRLHLLKYRHTDSFRKATLFKLAGSGSDALPHPQCQWRYDSCSSPCFKTCSDPSAEACVAIPQVEGCLPVCPPQMVLDEVTRRCVFVEDCIKAPVILPLATTSSTTATALLKTTIVPSAPSQSTPTPKFTVPALSTATSAPISDESSRPSLPSPPAIPEPSKTPAPLLPLPPTVRPELEEPPSTLKMTEARTTAESATMSPFGSSTFSLSTTPFAITSLFRQTSSTRPTDALRPRFTPKSTPTTAVTTSSTEGPSSTFPLATKESTETTHSFVVFPFGTTSQTPPASESSIVTERTTMPRSTDTTSTESMSTKPLTLGRTPPRSPIATIAPDLQSTASSTTSSLLTTPPVKTATVSRATVTSATTTDAVTPVEPFTTSTTTQFLSPKTMAPPVSKLTTVKVFLTTPAAPEIPTSLPVQVMLTSTVPSPPSSTSDRQATPKTTTTLESPVSKATAATLSTTEPPPQRTTTISGSTSTQSTTSRPPKITVATTVATSPILSAKSTVPPLIPKETVVPPLSPSTTTQSSRPWRPPHFFTSSSQLYSPTTKTTPQRTSQTVGDMVSSTKTTELPRLPVSRPVITSAALAAFTAMTAQTTSHRVSTGEFTTKTQVTTVRPPRPDVPDTSLTTGPTRAATVTTTVRPVTVQPVTVTTHTVTGRPEFTRDTIPPILSVSLPDMTSSTSRKTTSTDKVTERLVSTVTSTSGETTTTAITQMTSTRPTPRVPVTMETRPLAATTKPTSSTTAFGVPSLTIPTTPAEALTTVSTPKATPPEAITAMPTTVAPLPMPEPTIPISGLTTLESEAAPVSTQPMTSPPLDITVQTQKPGVLIPGITSIPVTRRIQTTVLDRMNRTSPGVTTPFAPVEKTKSTSESITSMAVSFTRMCTPPYAEIVDECTKFICVNNQLVLFNKSQSCPFSSEPVNCGLLGFAILVNGDKCCPQWDCPCRCSVFPDLNVITFDGNSVAIYKAAWFIVTKLPNETVSVLIQECPDASESPLRWNFTNLCLVALNITHNSNHIVIDRLQRRLNVNSRYARPRFKKFGFEIYDTGNMYLIRSPAGLQLQWYHSTGMMVIDSDSPSKKLPTRGLCGFCDGDPSNDLTLANGTAVGRNEDPSAFIDSWQVPNTTSYVSHSRRREFNCSTSDCSRCLVMLQKPAFFPCHAYVSPSTFCEVWVRDVEYVNNQCVSLAAYVASCHKFNVCIEWRRTDFCPFTCPETLRYQACLPACTSQSCPNQDFDFEPAHCSGLTEGCTCPEGTLLHRPYTALCIPSSKCACTDSSEVPRAHGEVWKASKDSCCMYRCDKDTVIPVEYNCSTTTAPVCQRTGEVVVSLADDTNCCPRKVCVCNLTHCELLPPVCNYGEKLVSYYQKDSCCPDYVCECDPTSCEAEIPTCRSDQFLIAARADDSCCLTHICVCSSCVDTPPLCRDGEVLTVSRDTADRCCPTYQCVCEPSRCPQLSCPFGMSLVSVSSSDHCCPNYTCVCSCDQITPPKCEMGEVSQLEQALLSDSQNQCGCKRYKCVREAVCVYQGVAQGVLRPGQTLVEHREDGLCYSRQCSRVMDMSSGYHVLRTSTTNCSALCQLNQIYSPAKDQSTCCGVCKNISCLYTHENGSTVLYKPGKSWVSNCLKFECTDTRSGPTMISYPFSCPTFNETECIKIGGTVVSYMDGCCKTCKEDGKSCQKVTVRMTIRKNDCRSNRPVNIVSCDGKCPSASIYNYNINTYARFCKCCREMGLQRRSVQLYCSGNSTWVSYSIQEPTDCSCQWS